MDQKEGGRAASIQFSADKLITLSAQKKKKRNAVFFLSLLFFFSIHIIK